MCKKTQFKTCPSRLDACMVGLIKWLNRTNSVYHLKTLASCCGHGRYPMSVVVQNKEGLIYEALSCKVIPRKRRFYKKDAKGYYYIPETIAPLKDGDE